MCAAALCGTWFSGSLERLKLAQRQSFKHTVRALPHLDRNLSTPRAGARLKLSLCASTLTLALLEDMWDALASGSPLILRIPYSGSAPATIFSSRLTKPSLHCYSSERQSSELINREECFKSPKILL